MKIAAREPDGTCETCYKRSAWAAKWPKPNSISVLLSWVTWIMPVVFLTPRLWPRAGRFPRSQAIPILQTTPINLVKAIQSSGMKLESLPRAVLKISGTKGKMVNLLDFEYYMTGLAFALAYGPAVRSSRRSKAWSSLSFPELWLTRAPDLAFEDDRLKDLKFDLCPLVC